MKKLFTLPNLYVLLWTLYYTQGTFLPQGSVWSRMTVVLFLLISVYDVFYSFIKFRINPYLKVLGVLLLMFSVYGMVLLLREGGFDYLKMIYLSLLPTYSFFVWTKTNKIDVGWIKVAFIIMVGVIIIQYFAELSRIENIYSYTENTTINIAYEILALLPLIYLWRNKPIMQYVILALVLALVVSTVKRGAIIIGALCMVYFIYNSMKYSTQKTKWYIWLVVLAFAVVGARYVINFYANSEYAQLRLEYTLAGESSGRGSIFKQCWNIFVNSNVLGLLLGHGASATIDMLGVAAHNDWLEILVNQGLLGAIVYFIYWINFYKTFKYDKNPETKPILGTLLIIYFMATLFSMSYSAMTLPATLALGYCLAMQQKQKEFA